MGSSFDFVFLTAGIPMNILTICYPSAGGSGVVATELSKGLSDQGHNVHLVSSSRPLRLPEDHTVQFHAINVPSYDVFPDASYGMSAACSVSRILREQNIDCIHAHYAFPHALSGALARSMVEKPDIPLVTTLHGTDVFLAENHPCHFEIVRHALNQSNAITAVSSYLQQQTQETFQKDQHSIRVIPNFVNTGQFSPSTGKTVRDEIGCTSDYLLTHVSNFRRIKRSGDAIRILKNILEHGESVHLLMVGDGPEHDHVERLTHEFHLREHVTWIRSTNDIVKYIAASDLLLVTSEVESFSMAALEAISCEVPVINSARGGIREVIRDGHEGHHFNASELHDMAAKSVELLRDDEQRKTMGENGRKRVLDQFSKETVVRQYESLYEEICSSHKK